MLELDADALKTPHATQAAHSEVYDEALAALQMLGFQKAASEKALTAILKENPSLAVEELIRASLKRL